MYVLPLGDVVGMTLESLAEVLGIQAAKVRCHPRGEVNAVCHIAYMKLILEVAGPHITEDILRHLAMEPRHAVNLLREVTCEYRHRELLVGVVGICLTEVDELVPCDAQNIGIVRHILTYHRLREGIVTCRHGGVRREQRRRADNLHSLRERKVLLSDEVAYALDADECGMTLVAVVYLLLDTHLHQSTDTTHTQQYLLLQAVLPVATIEVVCNLAILLEVCLIVGIQEVEVCTTYLTLPYAS